MVTDILSMYYSQTRMDHHHRFKSWEHCYSFFQNNFKYLKKADVFDYGCLHLGFYLASWGMLRGSSFLLQKDYKVNGYFLTNVVMNTDYYRFFDQSESLEYKNIEGIDQLVSQTKRAYEDHIQDINGEAIHVTDTLASKILIGVYGNVPAYDRYFKDGLALFGIRTQLDEISLKEIVDFYKHNIYEFHTSGMMFSHESPKYPPMKLIDMYFWQIGFMMDHLEVYKEKIPAVVEFAKQYKSAKKGQMMVTV